MNAAQPAHEPAHADKIPARKYGAFQNEIYKRGMFDNVVPTVTTDPNELEEQAKQNMNRRSYNYVGGGAGERATMDANRLAFRTWKVRFALTAYWAKPIGCERRCGDGTYKKCMGWDGMGWDGTVYPDSY